MKHYVTVLLLLLFISCEKDEQTYNLTFKINYEWEYDNDFTPPDEGAIIKQYLNVSIHVDSLTLDCETQDVYKNGQLLTPNEVQTCDHIGWATFENIPKGTHSYLIISGNIEGKCVLTTITTREHDQIYTSTFEQ